MRQVISRTWSRRCPKSFATPSVAAPWADSWRRRRIAAFWPEHDADALDTLRQRFPEASLQEDVCGLADITGALASLVDHPERDPGIMLDPRGSDYQQLVWSLLREIPPGQTTSYGALAAMLGTRDAREVTEAIASNAIAILIPCHRVVKKDGSLSGYRWGIRRKRALLERERQGIPFQLG